VVVRNCPVSFQSSRKGILWFSPISLGVVINARDKKRRLKKKKEERKEGRRRERRKEGREGGKDLKGKKKRRFLSLRRYISLMQAQQTMCFKPHIAQYLFLELLIF
jgi:hypothetical protein